MPSQSAPRQQLLYSWHGTCQPGRLLTHVCCSPCTASVADRDLCTCSDVLHCHQLIREAIHSRLEVCIGLCCMVSLVKEGDEGEGLLANPAGSASTCMSQHSHAKCLVGSLSMCLHQAHVYKDCCIMSSCAHPHSLRYTGEVAGTGR